MSLSGLGALRFYRTGAWYRRMRSSDTGDDALCVAFTVHNLGERSVQTANIEWRARRETFS